MDISGVTTLIGSLGFPIAACCVLFWYLNKERETHAEEMKVLIETIQRELSRNDTERI